MRYIGLFLILFLLSLTRHLQAQDIQNNLDAKVNKQDFNGTILIQKGDTTIYHKSFGLATRTFDVPNTNETKYKIASITKLFTAVLILQLYEQDKIQLHTPVDSYLPDLKSPVFEKITVHQLLNHTSGMANMDTLSSKESAINNGIPIYQTPSTPTQIITKCCSDSLVNEPGSVFDYNNAEYLVLGKIIDSVYGISFEEVLHQQILEPLGMENSGLLHQYDIIKNLADSYFTRDDLQTLGHDLPVYIDNLYAAGAMYSTSTDLLTFSNALFGGKLLKKKPWSC